MKKSTNWLWNKTYQSISWIIATIISIVKFFFGTFLASASVGTITIIGFFIFAHAPPPSEWENNLSTILISIASLSLLCFSALGVILSVFGWEMIETYIENTVSSQTEEKMSDLHQKFEELQNQLRADFRGTGGFLAGALSYGFENNRPSIESQKALNLAISQMEQALSQIENLETDEGDMTRHHIINNLTFWLTLRGNHDDIEKAVKYAKELKETYHHSNGHPEFLNTWAYTAYKFPNYMNGENPQLMIREIKEELEGMIDQDDISNSVIENAEKHLEVIKERYSNRGNDLEDLPKHPTIFY